MGAREMSGAPIYICRAYHPNGGLHPGKLRPEYGGCYITWTGTSYLATTYDVLVNQVWDSRLGRNTTLPLTLDYWDGALVAEAVVAGKEATGEPLYLCQAQFPPDMPGQILPGKFRPGYQACLVSWYSEVWVRSNYYLVRANWVPQGLSSPPFFEAGINTGGSLYICNSFSNRVVP